MTLQASGSISLSDIAEEFGGVTPHSLSEFYAIAAGVPASGQISLGNFYSKERAQREYLSVYQAPAYYAGFVNNNQLTNFIGNYLGPDTSFTDGAGSYYIGLPVGVDLFTYQWENVGRSATTNSAGPHDFVTVMYPKYPEAFAVAPYYTQGNSGSTGDCRIAFTLAAGYTVSYYQQDQLGSGNDLLRDGQSYEIWRGITVSGLSGVPGIAGSGNGGSQFRIRRLF